MDRFATNPARITNFAVKRGRRGEAVRMASPGHHANDKPAATINAQFGDLAASLARPERITLAGVTA